MSSNETIYHNSNNNGNGNGGTGGQGAGLSGGYIAPANSRAHGVGYFSSISSQTLGSIPITYPQASSNMQTAATLMSGPGIFPFFDSGGGGGPGGGGISIPPQNIIRTTIPIDEQEYQSSPNQAHKLKQSQAQVVTRKRSSMMNNYPPPLPPGQQQNGGGYHQQMIQQQQQQQEIQQLLQSPHARRQSPALMNMNGLLSSNGKISAHQQYLQHMMQANGMHPSLLQVINTQNAVNNNNGGSGGVVPQGQPGNTVALQNQKNQIMDNSIPSPKMRPPPPQQQMPMNMTLSSNVTAQQSVDQQFINLKNPLLQQQTQQQQYAIKRVQQPVVAGGNPFGGGGAAQISQRVNQQQQGVQQQFRQRSVPYQSNKNNGIAGMMAQQMYNQAEEIESSATDFGNNILIEQEMSQIEQPTTRTEVIPTGGGASPAKANKQANHIIMGAPSSSTVNSSAVSTALSSQYNKKKNVQGGPPVTVSQVQPSPIQSKATSSFVQPGQQQNQQPVKSISSATQAQQPSQNNSQSANNQQLIIITVSNSQPNASGGGVAQKKLIAGSSSSVAGSQSGSNSTNDHKDPKQSLLLSIQEVVRLVVQRSEDINLLRQIVDLKTKKLKSKYSDSSFFYNLLQREWQRQSVEGYHLNKTGNVRVEDKSPLIKILQKQVKKMLKPFNRRRPNEDYLHAEVHLSEVMMAQETETVNSQNFQQQLQASSSSSSLSDNESNNNSSVLEQSNKPQYPLGYLNQVIYPPAQYKNLRKRNVRIIQASFKEQLVDPQVALSICIQYSRQAFFDEVNEYFTCVHNIIMAGTQGSIPPNCNIQTENFNYQNLRKVITKARQQSRVQLNLNKKLEKVYKVLLDANYDTLKQINTYRESYFEKQKKRHSRSMIIIDPSQLKKNHGSISPTKSIPPLLGSESPIKHQQSFIVSHSQSNIQEITTRSFISEQPMTTLHQKNIEAKRVPQMIQPPVPQPSQTPVTMMSDTQMNSTLSNFGAVATASVNKSSLQLIRGQSRGNSKLQPIIVPRNEINLIKNNQSVTEAPGNGGDSTPLYNPGETLARIIKKQNQLPSLGGGVPFPSATVESHPLLGTPSSNKFQQRRGIGLEPLPADHFIGGQKVASFHQENQSTSPLKRRHKVVIQGGLQRLGSNLEDSSSLGSPILRVFHSATQGIEGQNEVDIESLGSARQRNGENNASRKVIKATITIPMPKADLGGFKFKTSSKKLKKVEVQSEGSLSDNQSHSDEEVDRLDSPDISVMMKDASFINNTIVATQSLLNEPISAMQTVRQSSSTSKIGKGSFFNHHQISSYPPLSPIPSNYSQNPSQLYFHRMIVDMSQIPVNDRFDSLFSRYFNKKGIMAFVLTHRAKVIQRFYRLRIQYKLAAKNLIVKRFRYFVARQQRVHLFATKLFITVTQKRAVRAIERAYIRYRDRNRSKKSKVDLNYYKDYIAKIVHIQRYFRKRMGQRYSHGRKLVKRKEMQRKLFHEWWQGRLNPIILYESQMLHNQIQFMHNRQIIDEYVFQQEQQYMNSLFQYDDGLTKVVEKNFKEREWEYNKISKEWSNDRIPFNFKSMQDTKIAGQTHPALQYVIDANRRLAMSGPYQGLEEIQGVSEAITGLYGTELRNQRTEMLRKIKRQRAGSLLIGPNQVSSQQNNR